MELLVHHGGSIDALLMSLKALLQRPGLLLAGATVYVGTTAVTYLTFYEPPQETKDAVHAMTNAKRLEVFDGNATKYDKDVDFDETLMGLSLMRRFLLRNATGRVLEVAAGTGRNLAFYPKDAQLTLTDFSRGMLDQIPSKAKETVATCDLQVMSADALAFDDQSFDTVVDTFGLCSMDDSVQALREMQRVCKQNGKILLLEHGRSHYNWLSSILDKFAGLHVQRWGCHWNRDILALVEEAGLEIESVYRFHFGTTYYIVARPATRTTAKQ
ncbi:hypothetical protein Poli38472_011655 [Pythium oligandrum]|uniref:Methyltransferase domain-containing protein n=1 Tax=Pythium oligandrum TaxID=41045 RepID=A0A8K1CLC9_PYTOL|nr:hypothetical protein Poli38472_011655 [Pythium oligandrum]|eukprot:TMW64775.1 hypothetical protein Poli38472_011655 [Pythium oligandrum]